MDNTEGIKSAWENLDSNITFDIIEDLGLTNTRNAKGAENEYLLSSFQKTGKVPIGNQKSFKPN